MTQSHSPATALSPATPVLVVGAGAMGSGIAQVAARAGHPVYLYDLNAEVVAKGLAGIEKDLHFLVGKAKLTHADCVATLARLQPISDLALAQDAGLAVEAILENLEVKQNLFKQLEALLAPTAILASNTSSLSITAIAAALQRPERVAGLHFFNPAPRMALVEIVSGLATASEVADTLYATAQAWGKIPVRARSTPGFIVNRVARPYYAEALRVLAERAADPATLDAILRESCGFPMGPFELMDLIGHDVNFAVTRSVCDAYFGDRRFTPSLIQQELVLAGRLGRKSGQGFYSYAVGAAKPVPTNEAVFPAEARAKTIRVRGEPGLLAPLLERLAAVGVGVFRAEGSGPAVLEVFDARLALSDGRTATRRAAEEGLTNLMLIDIVRDFATTPRLALTRADGCNPAAYEQVVATLQAAGLSVSPIDDVAGMLALRTAAMLANEAADAVLAGIGSAADIDTAMRYGTNYPEGPLAWADRIGTSQVARVLAHLQQHYGEERYRLSPLLQRLALNGRRFHEG